MHRIEERLNAMGRGGDLQSGPIQDGIAVKLKELYHSFESEAVPDTLIRLLDRLDVAERARADSQSSKGGING